MPKKIEPQELEAIVKAVAGYPEGVGSEIILHAMELGFNKRTLQRRLAQLVADGRLITEGKGRALRYKAAPMSTQGVPDAFRLKYRNALAEVIRYIVLRRIPASANNVRAAIPIPVQQEDRERFVELVLSELENLYEGNIARFSIRPAEFAAWQK